MRVASFDNILQQQQQKQQHEIEAWIVLLSAADVCTVR